MRESIEQLINKLLHESEQMEEEVKQKSDLKNLTTRQLTCIELIHEMDNPTLSELAKELRITKPSASVMIDRLAENGYVSKIKSDSDRRSAHMHLTQKGVKAAKLHVEVHHAFANNLVEGFTESETDILLVLLNKALKTI